MKEDKLKEDKLKEADKARLIIADGNARLDALESKVRNFVKQVNEAKRAQGGTSVTGNKKESE